MATLAEDISFGTGQSVRTVEINLFKNTAGSLSLLGADYWREDGTVMTPDEQRSQLAAMFGGVSEAEPETLVLVARTRRTT